MVATISHSFTATLALLLLESNASTDGDDSEQSEDVVAQSMVVLDVSSVATHTIPLPSASPSPPTPSHSPLPLPHHPHPPTPLCLSLTTHTLPLPSASPSPPTPSHSPLPLPHHPHPPTPLCLSVPTHTLPLPSASPSPLSPSHSPLPLPQNPHPPTPHSPLPLPSPHLLPMTHLFRDHSSLSSSSSSSTRRNSLLNEQLRRRDVDTPAHATPSLALRPRTLVESDKNQRRTSPKFPSKRCRLHFTVSLGVMIGGIAVPLTLFSVTLPRSLMDLRPPPSRPLGCSSRLPNLIVTHTTMMFIKHITQHCPERIQPKLADTDTRDFSVYLEHRPELSPARICTCTQTPRHRTLLSSNHDFPRIGLEQWRTIRIGADPCTTDENGIVGGHCRRKAADRSQKRLGRRICVELDGVEDPGWTERWTVWMDDDSGQASSSVVDTRI
ncbi:hypothetical protein BLNAU_7425 [Blattamonas nauphoetae]|uniref:Uncharacterized protein n=1 Tax=Blattamonas nauphoetae TaxID=2049346 RepID=A0ABQ9Y1A8_9EUKA|nr:hypothetical protein BLNAU_7425 [Blattamonas nauphoetae]